MRQKVCARCGKVERLGRVFESISYNDIEFLLCVECAQILYKAEDARKEGNREARKMLRDSFEKGIIDSSLKPILTDWLSNNQSSD